MLISNPPYPFWSTWIYLSTSERLFLVLLGALCVYVLYSGAIALSCAGHRANAETMAALRKRSAKVEKLRATAFFLFGVVLFENMQWSYVTIDNSKTPGGWLVLQNFLPHFAFGFNVFLIFLILHIVGWLVSGLVNRLVVELKLQGVA